MSEDERKLERIRHLLDNWSLIWDGSPSTEPFGFIARGTPGSCEPGSLPQAARSQSVRELERCLRLLASASPGDYRHLKAYRCGMEWRNVNYWRRVKLPSGKLDWTEDRKRERVVPRWLDPVRVLAGEQFLVRIFRGECYVPDELGGKEWQAA